MGLSNSACRASEDAALADLPGVEFQHDVHLAVRDWTAWTAVSERLSCAGADVLALQVARSGGGFDVRCRLKQVSAQSARDLLNTLLDDGLADRGSIEHLVLPKRATEAA
jgi:hypothetical protein